MTNKLIDFAHLVDVLDFLTSTKRRFSHFRFDHFDSYPYYWKNCSVIQNFHPLIPSSKISSVGQNKILKNIYLFLFFIYLFFIYLVDENFVYLFFIYFGWQFFFFYEILGPDFVSTIWWSIWWVRTWFDNESISEECDLSDGEVWDCVTNVRSTKRHQTRHTNLTNWSQNSGT